MHKCLGLNNNHVFGWFWITLHVIPKLDWQCLVRCQMHAPLTGFLACSLNNILKGFDWSQVTELHIHMWYQDWVIWNWVRTDWSAGLRYCGRRSSDSVRWVLAVPSGDADLAAGRRSWALLDHIVRTGQWTSQQSQQAVGRRHYSGASARFPSSLLTALPKDVFSFLQNPSSPRHWNHWLTRLTQRNRINFGKLQRRHHMKAAHDSCPALRASTLPNQRSHLRVQWPHPQ